MFEITESIDGERGKIGRIQFSSPPNFSQIFDGSPQFYPGSLVQVQEILEIRTKVYDETLVSEDLTWFFNKRRLGTYQVIDNLGLVRSGENDQGYLSLFNQKLYRYSFYTITANPNVLLAQHEQIALDNCNFYLIPEVYLFPNDPTPDPGFRLYDRNPSFLGSVSISKAPLADTEYNQLISGIGLCLKPGVEGDFLRYRVSIVNDIYTDYPSAAIPTCEFLGASCQAQFGAFLAADPTSRFDNITTCQTTSFVGCIPQTWVCTTDPTQTFQYYIPVPN